MPGENPPIKPNPEVPNPARTGEGVIIENGLEVLQLGVHELAGNIVKVANTDPAAIKDFLDDILTDPENPLVTAAERAAAIQFLGAEQRTEIRRGLIGSGEQMLGAMSSTSSQAQGELSQTGTVAKRSVETAVEVHENEVGRKLHGGVEPRRVAAGHEEAARLAQRGSGAVTKHAEAFDKWARSQAQEAGKFSEKFDRGVSHERALDEASKVVDPDYTGEPRDLSGIIDEEVKKAASDKIQATIAAAEVSGKSPEEAVADLMTQQPDADSAKVIVDLRQFADKQIALVKNGSVKINGISREAEQRARSFAGHGREGYQYTRRVEEAMDLYQQQKRRLEAVADSAGQAVRLGANTFRFSQDELEGMKQKLATARARVA